MNIIPLCVNLHFNQSISSSKKDYGGLFVQGIMIYTSRHSIAAQNNFDLKLNLTTL